MMQPLKGFKVVDLSTWAFAPVCAAVLGDWGAEVIKIEDPRTGDNFREFLSVLGIDESQMPISLFGLNNRNKRGMAVDLKKREGKEILYKLIEEADIFVSNLPTRALERLEMDYGKLSSINPRLVYAHASGYGDKGPDANKPGFDASAYWARSGLMAGLGVGGQPPVSQQFAGIGDQVCGLVFFGAVMLALFNREKTGRGQEVDLSLYGVGTWVTSLPIQMVLSSGEEPPRTVRQEGRNPTSNYYECRDGRWLFIISLPDEPYWSPLCKVLGLGDVEHDPKFTTRQARLENNIELFSIMEKAFKTRDRDDWAELLDENGIVWTHIPSNFQEVIDDPTTSANDHIVEVEHPEFGPSRIITTPIRLNKEVPPIRILAPELGQHNEEVLLEMGYTREDLTRLKDEGVIP